MPLSFHPKPGHVLMCDFGTAAVPPEMVKKRPVVVLPRSNAHVCTAVPLSTRPPQTLLPHHHEMAAASLPGDLARNRCWAKCDMIATVSLARLDRVRTGRGADGRRRFVSQRVTPADLEAVRRGVLFALDLDFLIWPPPPPII